MADSENSRTLPAIKLRKKGADESCGKNLPYHIDRRNLLRIAAQVLSKGVSRIGGRRESGPTPVRELWPVWYAYYQSRVRYALRKKRLASDMMQSSGNSPSAQPKSVNDGAADRSLAAPERVAHLYTAPKGVDLGERQKTRKRADKCTAYCEIAALEEELAEQSLVTGRVMLIAPVSSAVEVAAKLHCLIVTHDPGLKLQDAPWPQLRTILKDLIRIAGRENQEHFLRPTDESIGLNSKVSL
jgi:hypothetical protein